MKSIPSISFKSQDGLNDIEILEVSQIFERVNSGKNHDPCKPHRLNFFALLIVTKGTGTHQVDLERYPLKKGSLIKIAKNQIHAFQNNLNYKGYLVVFTEDLVVKKFSRSSIDHTTHLYNYYLSTPLIENEKYGDTFLKEVLHELKNETSHVQREVIAKLLELYLLRLEQQNHKVVSQSNKPSHLAIFNRFKSSVESSYTQTRNVKDYARQLQISPKHLNNIVRQTIHNNAKSFIDQYVILEAKRGMLINHSSIKEVAFSLGFDELTNFTKFFKKHTTISPREFKSSL
ncbi:MAG: helix-turn-helix transcriptional regulator [Owenweeksia sp.]